MAVLFKQPPDTMENVMKHYLYLAFLLALLACQTTESSHNNPPSYQSEYTLATRAAHDMPQKVQQIISYLKLTMVDNIGLFWHNYSWEGKQVLLVYPSQNDSYLWPVGKQVLAVSSKKLPPSAQGLYAEVRINGRQTLTLNLEASFIGPDINAAALGIHEAFHFWAQESWRGDNQRATVYPNRAAPRLYRLMTYKALAKYWKSAEIQRPSPEKESLGHARYWHERWLKEFPDELKRSYDITEGTARYVELLGQAVIGLQQETQEISEANLQKFLQDNEVLFSQLMIPETASLDGEAYGLGALAVTMLRFGVVRPELSLEDWNDLMANRREPLDVLLENIAPIAQEPDQELQKKMAAISKQNNQALAPTYDLLISQWQDTANYVRLRLPFAFLHSQGNLYPSDFGYLQAIGQAAMQLAKPHAIVSTEGGKTKLELAKGFIDEANTMVVMLKRSLFKQTDKLQTLTISSADSEGFINGVLQGRLQEQGEASYFIAE